MDAEDEKGASYVCAAQRKSILARERETRNEKCSKLRFYRIGRTARRTRSRSRSRGNRSIQGGRESIII